MSELRALMREDDDTASTGSEDPDAEDRATVTTVTIEHPDIVTQRRRTPSARAARTSRVTWWGAAAGPAGATAESRGRDGRRARMRLRPCPPSVGCVRARRARSRRTRLKLY